jgi:hypothetical protein
MHEYPFGGDKGEDLVIMGHPSAGAAQGGAR